MRKPKERQSCRGRGKEGRLRNLKREGERERERLSLSLCVGFSLSLTLSRALHVLAPFPVCKYVNNSKGVEK